MTRSTKPRPSTVQSEGETERGIDGSDRTDGGRGETALPPATTADDGSISTAPDDPDDTVDHGHGRIGAERPQRAQVVARYSGLGADHLARMSNGRQRRDQSEHPQGDGLGDGRSAFPPRLDTTMRGQGNWGGGRTFLQLGVHRRRPLARPATWIPVTVYVGAGQPGDLSGEGPRVQTGPGTPICRRRRDEVLRLTGPMRLTRGRPSDLRPCTRGQVTFGGCRNAGEIIVVNLV